MKKIKITWLFIVLIVLLIPNAFALSVDASVRIDPNPVSDKEKLNIYVTYDETEMNVAQGICSINIDINGVSQSGSHPEYLFVSDGVETLYSTISSRDLSADDVVTISGSCTETQDWMEMDSFYYWLAGYF